MEAGNSAPPFNIENIHVFTNSAHEIVQYIIRRVSEEIEVH
jgi:hypothetical protein